MNRLYYVWRTFQERFVQYVAASLLLALTLLAGLEVIRRYVFGVSFEWQQDAVTFGILAGVYLFFAITQSRGAHLRVTIVLILLREKTGRWGRIVAGLFEIFGAALSGSRSAHGWCGGASEVADLMILQERKTESLAFLLLALLRRIPPRHGVSRGELRLPALPPHLHDDGRRRTCGALRVPHR